MTIIHHYLRKELLFLLCCILPSVFLLPSCQKQPELAFGSQYVTDNNSANIVVVDSATIDMSTVYTDSTATAATGYIMVGSYQDPYLGNVSSTGYMQMTVPNPLPAIDPQLDTYDSVGLIMVFKKGNPYYGDTTIAQTFKVNQIDTLFQLAAPHQVGWFSNYTLPVGPTLGSTSVVIDPNVPYVSTQNSTDTVKIKMDDGLGRQLYNMVYNKSDTVKTLQTFLNWFHGLTVSDSSATQGIIYGFQDTSTIMRVYYRENSAGGASTTKTIDFKLGNKSFQFNSISPPDVTAPALAHLNKPTYYGQSPPLTPSDSTGHASFVQTIGGLNVKLTFPYLNAIALRPDYIGILRAQLTVIPLANSFNTIMQLPPQVGVYTTDQHNLIGAPVFAVGGTSVQTGNLVINYFQPLQSVYSYDVTNFVKAQITNTSPTANQTGLILSVPQPTGNAAFKRLIVADQSFPANQRIILSVYYISLYPHQ